MATDLILMVVVAIFIARIFAKVLAVPYSYLGPIIIMLALNYEIGRASCRERV